MKKLLLIIIVLSIILSISFVTFAVENEDYNIPQDGRNYWVIHKSNYGDIRLVTCSSPIYRETSTSKPRLTCRSDYAYYIKNGNDWRYNGSSSGGSYWAALGLYSEGLDSIIASNHDIYFMDSNNQITDIVFFSPPKVYPLVKGIAAADSGMILKTISHGLILVSGCLISAICFRKAWAFLHNLLQH